MNISKSLLLEAIPNIGVYTRAETEILKKLIDIEVDNISVIPIKALKSQLSLSHTSVYSSLKSLQNKQLIEKVYNQSNSYKLNTDKLNHIIKLYKNINTK